MLVISVEWSIKLNEFTSYKLMITLGRLQVTKTTTIKTSIAPILWSRFCRVLGTMKRHHYLSVRNSITNPHQKCYPGCKCRASCWGCRWPGRAGAPSQRSYQAERSRDCSWKEKNVWYSWIFEYLQLTYCLLYTYT